MAKSTRGRATKRGRHHHMVHLDPAGPDGWSEIIFPDARQRLWHRPRRKGTPPPATLTYRLACCDCGLTHDVEFWVVKVVRGRGGKAIKVSWPKTEHALQFRFRRNNHATANIRRGKAHKENHHVPKTKPRRATARALHR